MVRWSEFVEAAPRVADAVNGMLHQYGPGLGYLATVRADGGPRVHPVSPVVRDGRLYCFILASPKRDDLERDGRYALHAFPNDSTEDEAYLTGRAERVVDPAVIARLAADLRAEPKVDWWLFELSVEVAMSLQRRGVGSARLVWRDGRVRSRTVAADSVQ